MAANEGEIIKALRAAIGVDSSTTPYCTSRVRPVEDTPAGWVMILLRSLRREAAGDAGSRLWLGVDLLCVEALGEETTTAHGFEDLLVLVRDVWTRIRDAVDFAPNNGLSVEKVVRGERIDFGQDPDAATGAKAWAFVPIEFQYRE